MSLHPLGCVKQFIANCARDSGRLLMFPLMCCEIKTLSISGFTFSEVVKWSFRIFPFHSMFFRQVSPHVTEAKYFWRQDPKLHQSVFPSWADWTWRMSARVPLKLAWQRAQVNGVSALWSASCSYKVSAFTNPLEQIWHLRSQFNVCVCMRCSSIRRVDVNGNLQIGQWKSMLFFKGFLRFPFFLGFFTRAETAVSRKKKTLSAALEEYKKSKLKKALVCLPELSRVLSWGFCLSESSTFSSSVSELLVSSTIIAGLSFLPDLDHKN